MATESDQPEDGATGFTLKSEPKIVRRKTMVGENLGEKLIEYGLAHLSGRFWIAAIMGSGWVASTMLIFMGEVKLDNTSAVAVYTAFTGGAVGVLTLYMNNGRSAPQNQPPTVSGATQATQTTQTTVTK